MHRFANKSLLIRLRLSALLLVVFALSMFLLPLAVVWGTLIYDPRGLQASIILLPTAVVSGLLFLLVSSDVRCPLCRGQVMRRMRGAPIGRGVQPLLGSYRFRVVTRLFFTGNFRCLHCGETCDATDPRH
ncbi:hypothetical protein [Haloferula sp. A504]|uniref:hypothetical protein n=1 Tax=Haloferula sp. A504 TaxID=3373601 RepID=UPI0037C015D6